MPSILTLSAHIEVSSSVADHFMTSIEFAPSYSNPAGSPIRELFPFLSRPGMISFAGGYPSPSLFDSEGLRDAAQHALADSATALQYGPTEGSPALRKVLSALCATRGIICEDSQIVVTTGSQQAFDLLVRIFVAPGTAVFVESPAYPAAIQALQLAQARIEEIPVDQDGLNVEYLRERLKAKSPMDRPKLLYTVPTFSNPCGTLLTQERREALVSLAVQYNFFIIEDDPYGELTFESRMPEPLFVVGQRLAGKANPVIYLSSLSKTVAPALRVGWMTAPADVLRRVVIAKQTADLCTSPLAQSVATQYMLSGRYAPTVEHARREYRGRVEAMMNALEKQIGGEISFVRPKGGMFLWVDYSRPISPQKLFKQAIDRGILYVPGSAFYVNTNDAKAMRLSYAAPSLDDIPTGVKRLAEAMHAVV